MSENSNDFDPAVREKALNEAATNESFPAVQPILNAHAHTFYSFNYKGYSPTTFALEAKRGGLEIGGIVDFDVFKHMEKDCSPPKVVVKTFLLSSYAEWLTWETCDVYVDWFHCMNVTFSDIVIQTIRFVIGSNGFHCLPIIFATEYMLEWNSHLSECV